MISPRPAPSHPPRATLKAAIALGSSLGPVVLAGCACRGRIDRPGTLEATRFSYLNGDDIRAARVPGTEMASSNMSAGTRIC